MHLPEPAFTFTIPSIHDDTPLDCRIFHPTTLFDVPTTSHGSWKKKGAVIAHPYAPLGGSYDDHVVGAVAEELLNEGFIVGTFNFRGAHSSKGRTSWTGRPELDDYISFAGFLIHYLNLLHLLPSSPHATIPISSTAATLSADDAQAKEQETGKTLIILGGYSYGSLIAKHLPPTPQLLEHFSLAIAGSAAAEILLRSHTLSSQANRGLEDHKNRKTSHENSLTVKMGGEETSPDIRRSSREIRRSGEHGRSIDLPHAIHSLSLRKHHEQSSLSSIPSASQTPQLIPAVSTAYLLLSTIPPPLSTLMIPAIGHKLWNRHKDHHADNVVQRPTLALFGDGDGFVAVKKYRQWAARLAAESGSRFQYQEVEGAGHFWNEVGVEARLRGFVKGWVEGLRAD